MISDGDTHPSRLNSVRAEKMRHRCALNVTASIYSFNQIKTFSNNKYENC